MSGIAARARRMAARFRLPFAGAIPGAVLLLLLTATAGVSTAADIRAIPAPLDQSPGPVAPLAVALEVHDATAPGAARATEPRPQPRVEPRIVTYRIAPGDTLSELLIAAGAAPGDAEAALRALRARFDPRRLRAGQELAVVLDAREAGAAPRIRALSLSIGRDGFVVVRRQNKGFATFETTSPFGSDGALVAARLADAPNATVRLRKGETLIAAIARAGGTRREALRASASFERLYNLRRLKVGQEIVVAFSAPTKTGARRVAAVSLALGGKRYLVAARRGNGGFRATRARTPLIPVVVTPRETVAAKSPTPPPATEAAKVTAKGAETSEAPKAPKAWKSATSEKPEKKTPAAEAAAKKATKTPTEAPAPRAVTKLAPLDAATRPADGEAARAMADDDRVPGEKKTLSARKGDTLSRILRRAGATRGDTEAAVSAIGRAFDLRRLQIGQEITVAFEPATGVTPAPRLAAVSLALKRGRYLVAGREADGAFATDRADKPLLAALFPPPKPVAFAAPPENAVEKRLRIGKGDTLMDALRRAGSNPIEASDAIDSLRRLFNPRRLRTGQVLTVALAPGKEADGTPARPESLFSFSLAVEPGRSVEARRTRDGGFAARAVDMPLARVLVHAGGRIDSSLYQAASEAKVPQAVMMDFIRAFSYDIDFQRDIQRGDVFDILFERYLDDTGTPVREGNVLYGALTLSGERLEIFRYEFAKGVAGYFDENGQSVRKALLRTPINGGRLSSRYGKRKHPVLGYTKMHRGVDFAAPRGTPIFAAGDGVIERAGWFSSYGRYVRIRHRGVYGTAYAHMSRIAKGIRPGKRVKQGQVIGYVGSTGRTTGPHLHYEVLRAGRQINPLKVRMPSGIKLKDKALAAFQAERRRIETMLASLPLVRNVAEAPAAGCAAPRDATLGRGRRGEGPPTGC